MKAAGSSRTWVLMVLGVSLVLRVGLAARGGQYFFGDEGRYDRGVELYGALIHGDAARVRAIAQLPDHALFPWVVALVTAGRHGLAHFTGRGDWSRPENIPLTSRLGAALLSLFSALNLFLLHWLARRAGATDEEAAWALLVMAVSNTAFYYARHLLPYECAMAAALGAALVGLRRPTAGCAFGCGALTGATYGIYNGYWFLVPVLWGVHAFAWRSQPHRVWLAAWCAGGALLMLGVPVAIGAALAGAGYWAAMLSFSESVTLGVFAEGWSLPWEYFWHSEELLGVAVVAATAWALVRANRAGATPPAWVRGSLAALAACYLLLVLFSNVLHVFVVYARTVKPFVPLVCLPAGWALARLTPPRPLWRLTVASALLAGAALHFTPHFFRVFPRDVEIATLRNWGNPKRTLSVAGSLYVPLAQPVARPDLILVNAQFIYPVRSFVGFPAGRVLLRTEHPLSYTPFQYECHTPRERALLRTADISMELIQLADAAAWPDHPPLSLLYQNEDKPTGR